MVVDSVTLMYYTFQMARHAQSRTGAALAALNAIVDLVSQQRTLVVTVPSGLLADLDEEAR